MNTMKLRFARFFYIASQAFHLYSEQRIYTVVMLLCFAVAFTLPIAIEAFQNSVFNHSFYVERDFVVYVSSPDVSMLTELTNCDALREIAELTGASGEIQIGVLVFSYTTTLVYEGKILDGYFSWTAVDDGKGSVFNICSDSHILYGRQLLADESYECLVGSDLFPWIDESDLIGREILINAIPYTICGVIEGYRGVFASPESIEYIDQIGLSVQASGDHRILADALADELEYRNYDVDGVRFTSLSDQAAKEEYRKETNYYVVFTFGGYILCLSMVLGLLGAAMHDNRNRIFIKLALGAQARQIAIEYFIFFLGIVVFSSALALGLCQLLDVYFTGLVQKSLVISRSTILILCLISLITSICASFYSILWLARKMK